ncbi:hypothetical protein [Ignicoccus hospitalis]|uniref:Uncharacterized protein n=1 Tax=Ignicoccus hospitalis (strain KIN4/I / DSM 18386 / JCM 14125) TaxID=453591 RepID=A8A8K3_IGNH4|nr:hypothetical protein [Ignicoccus hospitalis]ABU81255.1 hypothetical protein Igni_0071 [Ignicoccus hospitalis KIN4/I]HIH90937.1 hypothetical protein [Desulfurococcaceae archaeon]
MPRRLEDWRDARAPLFCHVSEVIDEFGEVVHWKGPFDEESLALYSVFGIEPSRARANLNVGEPVAVVRVPPPHSKFNAVRNLMKLEHDPALVVKKGDRIFVEPALRHPKGFASLREPLKVAKEMSREVGQPVVLLKEVPGHCCWFVAPLAWTALPLNDAGAFRGGVPIGVSVPLFQPLEGCWEYEVEMEEVEGEGFPPDVLNRIKVNLSDKIKMKLVPLRKVMIRMFGKP